MPKTEENAVFPVTVKASESANAKNAQGFFSLVSVGYAHWDKKHTLELLKWWLSLKSADKNMTPYVFFICDTLQRFNHDYKKLPFYAENPNDPKYKEAIQNLIQQYSLPSLEEYQKSIGFYSPSELDKEEKPFLASIYRHMYCYAQGNEWFAMLQECITELNIPAASLAIVRWHEVVKKELKQPVVSEKEFGKEYHATVDAQAKDYMIRYSKNTQAKENEITTKLESAKQYVDEEAKRYEPIFILAQEKIAELSSEKNITFFSKIYDLYPAKRAKAMEYVAEKFNLLNKEKETSSSSFFKTKLSRTPPRIELQYDKPPIEEPKKILAEDKEIEKIVEKKVKEQWEQVKEDLMKGLLEKISGNTPPSAKEQPFINQVIPYDYDSPEDSDKKVKAFELKIQLEGIQKQIELLEQQRKITEQLLLLTQLQMETKTAKTKVLNHSNGGEFNYSFSLFTNTKNKTGSSLTQGIWNISPDSLL